MDLSNTPSPPSFYPPGIVLSIHLNSLSLPIYPISSPFLIRNLLIILLSFLNYYLSRSFSIYSSLITQFFFLILITFKIKFYNDGEGLFDFVLDEKDEKIYIKFKGVELLKWESRYVAKHNAHFFQLVTFNDEPFHYYIVLNGGKQVALNLKKFTKKIDKAVNKAKIRLAAKYNITLEQIELILKRRKDAKNKELEGIIGKKKDEILDEAFRESVDKELAKQLEETIGQAMAKEFDAIIIEGMEAEFASLIDQAIQEAVSEGISQATAEAAVRAIMEVLGAGGSEAEAMAACRAIAGDAC